MANHIRISQELKDLAKQHDISETTLYGRIRNRWKPELAATTPLGERPKDRFLEPPAHPVSLFPVEIHHWTPEQINDRLSVIGEDPERHKGPKPKTVWRKNL